MTIFQLPRADQATAAAVQMCFIASLCFLCRDAADPLLLSVGQVLASRVCLRKVQLQPQALLKLKQCLMEKHYGNLFYLGILSP